MLHATALCWSRLDDDGLKHIDTLVKSKDAVNDMENTWIQRFKLEVLFICGLRVGVDQTGQYLDVEPDLRHTPLIISESGCNTNTTAVSTPREKLQDKLVLDGCLHETFILVPRQIGSS